MSAPELLEQVLAHAAQIAGVAGSFAIVTESSHVDLRWALTGLTTNGVAQSSSVTVGVIMDVPGGRAVGTLTRTAVTPDQVPGLVADAAARAQQGAPAEDALDLVPGNGTVTPGWEDPAAQTGPGVLADVATQLGEVFARTTAAGRESFGFAEHNVTTTWLGTSTGVRYRHEQPNGSIELNGKSHQRTRSAWLGQATRDFSGLDVLAMDTQIAQRLAWQARTVELPPGRYDTILPPSAVADLLIWWYWSADARSASEGRSALSGPSGGTLIGQRLTDVPLTLRSDPAYPGLECASQVVTASSSPMASVFDNGLSVPATTWLNAGVLSALPATRHGAGLAGVEPRPFVSNLIAEHTDGAGTTESLIAGLSEGLLLTCLWYTREVDPMTMLVTGLTRDGVYRVEGGEVVGAVGNYRYNDSPQDILRRVLAAGAPQIAISREWSEYFARVAVPPLLVEGFHLSSASQAQ